MKIVFVVGCSTDARIATEEQPRSVLVSFAYHRMLDRLAFPLENLYIDSGAYTAFSSGKTVCIEEYAEFVRAARRRFPMVTYLNLDVIGDQDASWRNQLVLERLGLSPVPVVTAGADLRHLERALDVGPMVALGGLVPLASKRGRLESWLNVCFHRVMRRWQVAGIMPRVHLLGLGQPWIFRRYPLFSADASSWTTAASYGYLISPEDGKQRLATRRGRASSVDLMRANMRALTVLERRTTLLWESRGVRW